MAHVCAHSSESWVWKAYVSRRQWLNDTTYCPNSHSGSCAYLKKNNMRGNPTNRVSVVSVRLGAGVTFRLRVWPPLMLPLGQNRICLSFYLADIIWRVFTSVTWKVTPFKNRVFFNSALLLSYLWSKLGPKMVNARKGVVWPESHKWEGALRGLEGGERLKQDRAEPHTSFHSCVFIQAHCASQEMPSTVSMKMSFLLW